MAPPRSAASGPLARSIREALGWSLLNNLLARLGGVAVSVALARLLVPSDYGTFAVALVVLTALLSINELGVTLAVVRWPGPVEAIASTVNAIALSASALVACLGLASAGLVADLLGAPAAAGVVRLLCVATLVDGASSVPAALLTRSFRQKETMFIEAAGLLLSSTTSLVLAVRGHGAYSLAWGQLAGNAVVGGLLIARCRPYPGIRVRREVVRPLLAFGLPLAGSSALVFFMLNLDYIVVGRLLGTVALGFYFVGFNLASLPVNLLSSALRRVTVPAFVRTRDTGGDLPAAFVRTVSVVLVAVLPACLFLSVHADVLLHLVYGSQWKSAGDVLAVLAVFAVVRIIADLAYDLLVCLGRSRSLFLVQLGWITCLLVALPLGAHVSGIRGVAVAHLVVGCLFVLPAFVLTLRRAGLPVRPLLRAGRLPAVSGGLVLAGAAVIDLLVDADLPGLALSGVVAGLGSLAIGLRVVRQSPAEPVGLPARTAAAGVAQ